MDQIVKDLISWSVGIAKNLLIAIVVLVVGIKVVNVIVNKIKRAKALEKMDKSYAEAASDLGATPWQVFWKVQVPLSMPGVISGVMMVFMPTISTFAIAELLTMNNIKLFGTTIQENINNGMWHYGAALSLIMLIIIAITSLFSDSSDESANEGLL